MKYAHKKHKHTQDVGEWETVRQSLLKRAGWYPVEETAEPKAKAQKTTEPKKLLNEGKDLKPTALPDDFPGVESLREAKIKTFADLHEYQGNLTEIAGIGDATAEKIRAALPA